MKVNTPRWVPVVPLVLATALLFGCNISSGGSGPNATSISGLSPSVGGTSGGTAVTISGNNLQSGSAVTFGGVTAKSVNVLNSSQMTAVTPAHSAGLVDVVVTNPSGKSTTLPGAFGYGTAAPTILGVSPNSGPIAGGTTVNITGGSFAKGALVFFGAVAATGITVASATQIQATTPSVSSAAAVNVVVQNSDGQSGSLNNGFTYTNSAPNSSPTVSSVSPSTVSPGSAITVEGSSFGSGAAVTVGNAAASSVQFLNSTQLTATVPSISPGTYDVTVANTNGLSATLPSALTVADPKSLLSGCTVTTAGTLGSRTNGKPAISCSTPSGWTLVSAENFAGGVQHASDKTYLGTSGKIVCNFSHTGSCSYQATYGGDGCSHCDWSLNPNIVSGSTVYISWWQHVTAGATAQWNFYFAKLFDPTGAQWDLFDHWAVSTDNRTTPDVPPGCLNGVGPGYDFSCQSAQLVMSPGSNNTSGVNGAFYGPIKPLAIGSWTQYEIYFQANTPGLSNGSFQFYMNGQLAYSKGGINMNGSFNMTGMRVQVGGYYQAWKWTDSSGTTCVRPSSSGAIHTATSFSNFSPCPIPSAFSRYFDDIIVLAK